VEPDADTLGALQRIFGRGNVKLVRTITPVEPERPEPRGRPF
jgi:hypothetical protein